MQKPSPAILPAYLMNQPYRELEDLAVGETGYFSRASMAVSPSGECFLDPTAWQTERGYSAIQVERRDDGYHVVVIAPDMKWTPHKIAQEKAVTVVSVIEHYDPSLQDPLKKLRSLK